jgi:3-phosphoshikimate 1-carboxyvinyltransferase
LEATLESSEKPAQLSDQAADVVVIRPARRVMGELRLPGDKSISHRYAMLAAIAEGTTKLENFSTGADCASTLGCVQALGREVKRNGGQIEIVGQGTELRAPEHALDCGNSGSTMRMLSGILAGQTFASELRGDESLSRRPMARIIKPLSQMGAKISASDGDRPPLRITGSKLRGIEYETPVASAQVKTSLLFAGLLADGETKVSEPLRTRDHGEQALRAFGAEVRADRNEASIRGGQKLHGIEARIPGDISTAAFFLCAAALLPGSDLVLDELLLNPTRTAILDVLGTMGARLNVVRVEEKHRELQGSLRIAHGRLHGRRITGALSAALIDELPVLAAIAPYTEQGIEIRDARELRVKESDRIEVVAQNLRAMGAQVQTFEDGLEVPGGQKLRGGEVDSAGDHRIAMAFAVAALRAEGETTIRGANAARISYPEFFKALESVVG